ncbi:MAG: MerR family transcriptional regulator [Actinomycetota bacterium]|nr:MerR family transcriptional regulator [Actinomycetota bacterium]
MSSYRVEEVAAKAEVSVDTIRYYQAKNLLPPPARIGRVAWYCDEHLARLAQIRRLQARGFGLAVIRRLVSGELDRADEELVAAVASNAEPSPSPSSSAAAAAAAAAPAGDQAWFSLEELAERSGIPLAVLKAVSREGLLVARQWHGEARYSEADVTAAAAGLQLLEHGLPLPELLELARAHSEAMRATAERAVELFDRYVRQALRAEGIPEDVAAARLVTAFEDVLPATLTIVAHHFRRTLLDVAQEHIERVGSDDERQVVTAVSERPLAGAAWAG